MHSVPALPYDKKKDATILQQTSSLPVPSLLNRFHEIHERTGSVPVIPGKFARVVCTSHATINALSHPESKDRPMLEIAYEIGNQLRLGTLDIPIYVSSFADSQMTQPSASSTSTTAATMADEDVEENIFLGSTRNCLIPTLDGQLPAHIDTIRKSVPG